MEDEMSKKAQDFLDELRDLCRRHGVCLSVSGYDSIQVWNLDDRADPIHANGINDRTAPASQPASPPPAPQPTGGGGFNDGFDDDVIFKRGRWPQQQESDMRVNIEHYNNTADSRAKSVSY